MLRNGLRCLAFFLCGDVKLKQRWKMKEKCWVRSRPSVKLQYLKECNYNNSSNEVIYKYPTLNDILSASSLESAVPHNVGQTWDLLLRSYFHTNKNECLWGYVTTLLKQICTHSRPWSRTWPVLATVLCYFCTYVSTPPSQIHSQLSVRPQKPIWY